MSNIVNFVLNLQNNIGPALSKAGQAIQNFVGQANTAQNGVDGLGNSLGKIGGLVAGAFAAQKIYQFGSAIVKAGADMEATRIRFEIFTGSVEAANEQIAAISKLAATTPFAKSELLEVGKMLEVAGVHGKETIDVIRQLGNISAATGADLKALTTEIYIKNKGNGLIRGADLNQFTAYGLSIEEFAKQLGVSSMQLRKMASEGKVSFGDLQKYLKSLGGETGKWGKLMDRLSGTLGGKWSNLQDTIEQMMSDFGESKNGLFHNVIDQLNDVLGWVKTNSYKFDDLFQPFIQAGETLVKGLLNVEGGILKDVTATGLLEQGISSLQGVIDRLSPAMHTVAEDSAEWYKSFIKLGDGLDRIYRLLNGGNSFMSDLKFSFNFLVEGFTRVVDSLTTIVGGISDVVDGIGKLTQKDWSGFSQIGQGLKGTFWDSWSAFGDQQKYRDIRMNGVNDGQLTQQEYARQVARLPNGNVSPFAPVNPMAGGWGSLNPFAKPQSPLEKVRTATASLKNNKGGGSGSDKSVTSTKVGDVAGTKPTNVNVNISELVGQKIQQQHNTNLKESTADLKEQLTQLLLEAIRDSSRLAGV